MKALDLTVLFMVLLKRVIHFLSFFKTYLDRETLKVYLIKTVFYEKASKFLRILCLRGH